jgi:hypothetical protein
MKKYSTEDLLIVIAKNSKVLAVTLRTQAILLIIIVIIICLK